MPTPRIHSFHHGDTGTWTYLVAEGPGSACALIDPVMDFDPVSGQISATSAEAVADRIDAESYRLEWILETHAHADHLTAAQWFRRRHPGARVAIGEGIVQVQRTFRELYNLGAGFPCDGSQFDHLFATGERFGIGNLQAEVLATPGHTSDSLSFHVGDAVFVGDSLFLPEAGTARCDFPGGDAGVLFRSIQGLYRLPPETRVFVCHDYPSADARARCESTIGAQRRDNIHVRDGVAEAEFLARRRARDATLPTPKLMLAALQVNIRAGHLPEPESNGRRYLKLPLTLG